MSDIDQQFIEFVVKSLVGKPDAVSVARRVDEKGVLLELTVDPEDLGRVIGKRGATAQSLRTLLRALGTKNDARYNLKIIDNGIGDHGHAHQEGEPPRENAPAPVPDSSSVSSDDASDDSAPAPVTDEPSEPATDEPTPAPAVEEDELPPQVDTNEDEPSDRLAQTRKELADLDDLDV